MNAEQQHAILAIALFAAFSDGVKDEREREHIRQLATSLGNEAHLPDLPRLYQDVLLKRVSLASATAALTEPNHRQLAYEMAVCVCDADGRQSEAEQRFLEGLRGLLGLETSQALALGKEADTLAELTEKAVPPAAPATPAPATPRSIAASPVVAAVPKVPDSELDQSILNAAIINGALELLPQSWASVAIIPLQIKLVYKIGKAHGVELDQGHIKEFLATAGVGLTSQYLEQFGRKLLGGLLGKAAGGFAGKIGRTATGMAFSFATTYALGQLAKRYYAGGRQMSGAVLRETFENLLGPAKEMQARYLPDMQQTASRLDAGKVMALVRGS